MRFSYLWATAAVPFAGLLALSFVSPPTPAAGTPRRTTPGNWSSTSGAPSAPSRGPTART